MPGRSRRSQKVAAEIVPALSPLDILLLVSNLQGRRAQPNLTPSSLRAGAWLWQGRSGRSSRRRIETTKSLPVAFREISFDVGRRFTDKHDIRRIRAVSDRTERVADLVKRDKPHLMIADAMQLDRRDR
jgi:hypothetical protein